MLNAVHSVKNGTEFVVFILKLISNLSFVMLERFDIDTAKAAMLYISGKFGKIDLMRLFKILYFAEKYHLKKWGSLIVNDTYIAMKYGPVPSLLFDLFKGIRGDGFVDKRYDVFYKVFKVEEGYHIIPLEEPDMDWLSIADVESLDKSINEYKDVDFDTLSSKSHDDAWNNADINNKINFMDIVKASGASDDMIDYIVEQREISEILGCV